MRAINSLVVSGGLGWAPSFLTSPGPFVSPTRTSLAFNFIHWLTNLHSEASNLLESHCIVLIEHIGLPVFSEILTSWRLSVTIINPPCIMTCLRRHQSRPACTPYLGYQAHHRTIPMPALQLEAAALADGPLAPPVPVLTMTAAQHRILVLMW